jgi:hypothetical protein
LGVADDAGSMIMMDDPEFGVGPPDGLGSDRGLFPFLLFFFNPPSLRPSGIDMNTHDERQRISIIQKQKSSNN